MTWKSCGTFEKDVLSCCVTEWIGSPWSMHAHRLFGCFTHLDPPISLEADPPSARWVCFDMQLAYASDFNLVPIEHDLRKTRCGATAGAGVEFKRNQMGLLLEALHQHNFDKFIECLFCHQSGH